jgi:hypothetical protein
MIRNHLKARIGRGRATLLGAALVASLAALSSAAPGAFASEFEEFKQCPTSNPSVVTCLIAKATSGEFTVGNRTVPIKHTVTLQGGLVEIPETGTFTLAAAKNGETLSKTPQTVPGGLIGIEGLFGEVTATTELAKPASSVVLSPENLIIAEGTALTLPVRLKLGNPLLGNSCYGGSSSHPITLNLTTGTTSPPKPNKPISGKTGTITEGEDGEVLVITENSLVNNSFSAPGVEGCGLIPFLFDPIVDASMGVPDAEGHNTAILDGTIKLASAEHVVEHLG